MFDTSLNRRDFLLRMAVTGSALTLAGPSFAGRFLGRAGRQVSLSAFLPDRDASVAEIIDLLFSSTSQGPAGSVVLVDSETMGLPEGSTLVAHLQQLGVKTARDPWEMVLHPTRLAAQRGYRLRFQLRRLAQPVPPDLTVSMGERTLLHPRKGNVARMEGFRALAERWQEQSSAAHHFVSLQLAPWAPSELLKTPVRRPEIVIESNGEERYRLGFDTPRRDLEVPGKLGTAVVRIDRGARILHAPCRNKICQKMGPAVRPGESLVCAPNGLVIRVVGQGDVDSVTW